MMRIPLLLLAFVAAPALLHAQRSPMDSANARAATDDYQRTGRARVVEAGTYSMVPFGHVQPTLRCAPLRVCTVELQSGERVIDSVLGDPERWVVDFAAGPDSTPLVVAKPVALPDACDLTTNLVVTTNRRIYHVTLDSPPCAAQGESTNPDLPYMRQVKFYFPDDALVRHHGSAEQAPSRGAQRGAAVDLPGPGSAETGAVMPVSDLGELHLDYQAVPDRRFPWVPRLVMDNGRQTCIRLPPEAYHSDLAVLYELNAQGGYELVQYVVRDGCILTDRVMQRMVLLIANGAGGDPLRLLIARRNPREGR
jgi:type IV secretion system protein TrbG